MSTTSAVTNTSTSTSAAVTAAANKTLDKDAFLRLLIAQMQNQDPLNPTDNTEYIAQLAQFSTLEQQQNLNKNFSTFGDTFKQSASASQAYSLAGQWVDYTDPNDSTVTLTGRVDGVTMESGVPKLKVGLNTIDLSGVSKVYPTYDLVNKGSTSSQAIALLGKSVDYIDPSSSDKVLTGEVKSVNYVNGWPKLKVGDSEIDLTNVLRIHSDDTGIDSADAEIMAKGMVGKWVVFKESASATTTVTGYVKDIETSSDIPRLKIGNMLVDLTNVVSVRAQAASS